MPNQYPTQEPIYQKCENAECINVLRRTPSQVASGRRKFCSYACMHTKEKKPRKYTDADIKWITENIGKVPIKQMAKMYDVSPETFRKVLCYYREKGVDIPKQKRQYPEKKVKDVKAPMVKAANQPRTITKEPRVCSSNHGKPPKPEQPFVNKSVPIGTLGYKMEKLNCKTWVMRKVG